jgi:predicted nucleic acid-binding protein
VTDPFVADSSIALAWVHPNQATALSRALLADVEAGAVIHVTSLWPLETGNALLVAVRRKLITDTQRKSALSLLSRLNVVIDGETASLAWTTISDLAGKHHLSLYDSTYLELALRKTLPLASRDEPLRLAARREGVKIL